MARRTRGSELDRQSLRRLPEKGEKIENRVARPIEIGRALRLSLTLRVVGTAASPPSPHTDCWPRQPPLEAWAPGLAGWPCAEQSVFLVHEINFTIARMGILFAANNRSRALAILFSSASWWREDP